MGGEIAHEKFACREKFIEHTLELEAKVEAMTNRTGAFFLIVFAGTGFQWHPDELEDFAETYFSGRCRWDHFAAMQEYTLRSKGVTFSYTIAGFCCFVRSVRAVAGQYRADVRVPNDLR